LAATKWNLKKQNKVGTEIYTFLKNNYDNICLQIRKRQDVNLCKY
jgi:hypothetical protein